jgi:hypothetical protein
MTSKSELQTEFGTGLADIVDPRVYAAKSRSNNPDSASFFQAMHGEFAEQHEAKSEIQSLIIQSTRDPPPSEATRVIKSTWVFKFRRFLDGSVSKFRTQ